MRYVSLLFCVLASLLCILAPPAHSADLQQYLAARLESPETGTTLDNLELVLENRSSKDIVAYAVDFTTSTTGASPRTSGRLIEDFVPSLASVGKSDPLLDKHTHVGPIHPGETVYRYGPANKPNAFTSVVVTMVIFGDNTAAGDADTIGLVFRRHKAYAEELERFLPKYTGGQPDLRQHFGRLKSELAQSIKQQVSSQEEGDRQNMRSTLLSQLTGALDSSQDFVALERWRESEKSHIADEIKAYKEHSELKRGGN